ncbi:syntaxin of plant 5 [Gossypium australe]|uniref:Syntaxin of plant 5 n=1 Tax=Gossypium australe TaxID=47621 RepID=A0A5B6VHN8_9ROSI|nr:syntaxin of plant 5 [Gossypium australe]
MYNQALMADAWIREAEEALKLVEDIENRVDNKNPSLQHHGNCVIDIAARSKLLDVGIKIDRLESLLRNPPSKPILTNEDIDYRWTMLSDMQLRTKALALRLYALPTSSRPGNSTLGNHNDMNKIITDYIQDRTKSFSSEEDRELFRPLISLFPELLYSEKALFVAMFVQANDVSMTSQVQTKQGSTSTPLSFLQKICWFFGAILGLAALTFILILICAVI